MTVKGLKYSPKTYTTKTKKTSPTVPYENHTLKKHAITINGVTPLSEKNGQREEASRQGNSTKVTTETAKIGPHVHKVSYVNVTDVHSTTTK